MTDARDKSYEDLFENEEVESTEGKSSDFAQMLEESFSGGKGKNKLKVGDKIKGEILVIGKEDVFVSTGTMNDGMVPRKDLLDKDGNVPYQVGDRIDLYVTQVRGSDIRLSPNPTSKNLADDLVDAFDMMLPVEGRVVEICNGGVRVQIHGKLAFCPVSQLDSRFVENPADYVGKKFEFRITQLSEGGRNIVVSRRKLLDEQKEISLNSFVEEKREGDIVQGTVTKLEKFGAFVEVEPGVEGLVHISELSWSRVNEPSEIVSAGQQVTVKVLKMEMKDGRMKISLSLKQAGATPWENLPASIKEGAVIEGKVTRCMKFGAFVELAPGVEGLVPLSEMSYTKRVMRSDEIIKEGERVSVMIKDVNARERRISLSLRDAGSDPWAMVPQNFPVGKIVKGKVERREAYGLFIGLDGGITGLLPKSKALENPDFGFDKLRIGNEVTVQIMEIKQDERKLSLCLPNEQGSEDWKSFAPQTSGSLGTLADKFREAMEKKNSSKK